METFIWIVGSCNPPDFSISIFVFKNHPKHHFYFRRGGYGLAGLSFFVKKFNP
jgi:hypothetical protein